MDGLYRKLFSSNTTKIMVLGGTCSAVSEQTCQAAHKYNMVQVGTQYKMVQVYIYIGPMTVAVFITC